MLTAVNCGESPVPSAKAVATWAGVLLTQLVPSYWMKSLVASPLKTASIKAEMSANAVLTRAVPAAFHAGILLAEGSGNVVAVAVDVDANVKARSRRSSRDCVIMTR